MSIDNILIEDILSDVGPCIVRMYGTEALVEGRGLNISAGSLKRALLVFGVYWLDRINWDPEILELLDLDWKAIKEELLI